jgi:methionyl-tRNA synthetase
VADSFYITTPIYYVNDSPHIGHAYTTIAADVAARWSRLQGKPTYFLTGTDEHGQKVHEAAARRGIDAQAHVDELCQRFSKLWTRLDITNDDFIRTTEARHTEVVQATLQFLYAQGDLYSADYEGWYSTSEERFWTEKDLVDGKCPQSGNPVQWIKEKNWFFRMSKYADQLRALIAEKPGFLQPESRRNEVLGYLKKEVGDLCISRPKTRLPWGIEIPFDTEYVTYVWFDALLNYITAIGYRPDESSDAFGEWWPASFHLVGKDILTTHAVYFSTMLFALGLSPADCLYAHGWWTIEGQKMSKSIGNVVDPHLLIDCYGADPVRYFLMREIPFGGDGDFSHSKFMTRYNADLANDLGNLAHRSLSMTNKWLSGLTPALDPNTEADDTLDTLVNQAVALFRTELDQMHISRALDALWAVVRAGNKYIDDMEPWRLNREGQTARLAGVMRRCLELCRVAGVLLTPVCPTKSAELLTKLGTGLPASVDGVARLNGLAAGAPLAIGEPLFPRMSALPAPIQEQLDAVSPVSQDTSAKPKKHKQEKVVETAEKPSEKVEESHITIDDFAKVELKAGLVVGAEAHPNADRLLVLKVDLGEDEPRTIVAGIAKQYTPEELKGKQVVIVANLKPVKLRGVVSQGMVLACGGKTIEGLVTVDPQVAPGSTIR